MSKNFGFESFCKSSWFDGFIAKPHRFFSTSFWQCCQSCIQGVQRNISWRKPIWNNLFFLNLFFRILNKKYSDFSQKHFGRFRENRSTCPEEQSMKKYETKNELINRTISRSLFWQLSDFWCNFSGHFVKTVFYLRVTFWWKAAFASERLISNFFDIWRRLSGFWWNCFRHSCTNCFLRV